jgi:nitrite reductase/ring-hydroxylating ferredoxin subunit
MEAVVQDGGDRAVSHERVLCALDDIGDPGGKGFAVAGHEPIFVVRVGPAVHGYVNVCPHQGTALDWKPDTFLTYDKSLIQCSTHWARFRIEDGECVAGPCVGQSLVPAAIRVDHGAVVLDGAHRGMRNRRIG